MRGNKTKKLNYSVPMAMSGLRVSLVGLFEKMLFDKSAFDKSEVFKKCIMKKCFFKS